MSRRVSRMASLFIMTGWLCTAVPAARANPAPEPSEFPYPPPEIVPGEIAKTEIATELRWMLAGAALALLVTACVLALVVWWPRHRGTARRLRTSRAAP